jgi:hypothetical protein
LLELETGWGAQQRAAGKSITPDECWRCVAGSRTGRYEAPGLICPHAKAEGTGGKRDDCDIPLIAQGEVLGLLSMERDADGKAAGALDPRPGARGDADRRTDVCSVYPTCVCARRCSISRSAIR